MNKRLIIALVVLSLALPLTACGGDRVGQPTALPPDVARPAQSTPAFDNSARVFRLTPPPTISARVESRDGGDDLMLNPPSAQPSGSQAHAILRARLVEQPPTALGIIRGQASLRTAPGGAIIETLFAGETVTVTGRSAGGRDLAVFTAAGVPGWISASGVTLYGADDLTVVEQAVGPGPVVTMIAEAMEPAETSVLDAVMTTMP